MSVTIRVQEGDGLLASTQSRWAELPIISARTARSVRRDTFGSAEPLSQRPAHRGGGRHRVMWRDLQSPALNPDTGESIAFQGVVHLVKAFRQRGPAISQPGLRTGLEASVPHDGFGIASGHEIAVETAILTAAIDPDIPGAQRSRKVETTAVS